MVAFCGSEPCGRAEAYYPDFLEDEESQAIPRAIADHIRGCDYCRRRLERLCATLAEVQDDEALLQSQKDRSLVAELQSQFELVGAPLGCTSVKPFLPDLLAAGTQIRVPTPVSVHVDQCAECAQDLASLRALDLNAEQLVRLSRLYADSSANGFWVCLRVQSSISLTGRGSLARVDAQSLDHLCVCPRCRNRLYQRRQRLLEREQGGLVGQGAVRCEDISNTDIFDFVVPYGDLESGDERGRSPLCRDHVQTCRHCLEKVQQLHRAVYGVLERPDSGVVTMYRTQSDQGATEPELLYPGYPIHVEVIRPEAGPGVRTKSKARRAARLTPMFRMALMAAAMIPIAVLFVLSARSASGLNPRQLDEIVAQVPYVRVTAYGPDAETSKQSEEAMWTRLVSRPDGRMFLVTARERTVTDVERGQMTVFNDLEGTARHRSRSSAERAEDRARFERVLTSSFRDLSPDGKLTQRDDVIVNGVRVEVYEMTGPTASDSGGSALWQWVAYVESTSRRPIKTEFLQGGPAEEGLMVTETRYFEYPEEDEKCRWLVKVGLAQP